MDSALAALAGGRASLRQAANQGGMTVDGGRVTVLVLTAPRHTGEALAAIGHGGGTVDAATAGSVEAEVAPADLAALSTSPGVRYLQPMLPDQPQSVQGQGVSKSGAGLAHLAGVTGLGVKVAVIDAGFTGLATSQAAGDIPANVTTMNFCSGGFDTTPHGTAVAEIVSEMAPDAQLYLVCASNAPELAQAEQYAVSQGITIVNRSESNFSPAVRGDGSGGPGTEDATVQDAHDHGILWVNSAGNYARIHWGGPNNAAPGGFLDFGGGDLRNTLSLADGRQVCLSMKWDSWPITSQNFDLYLYNGATDVFATAPTRGKGLQNGTQPPTESGCYTNISGATQTLGVAVKNESGGMPGTRIDIFVSNEGVGSIQYPVADGSVVEPATAPEALAVAAVCPVTDALQSYSSQGPTVDGRIKPDISGYAPVSTTAYGAVSSSGCGGGFGGTSSASPHVAGAAALYEQGNPGAGPDQLQALLEGSAIDLGGPGKDNQFGWGELNLREGQPDLLIKGDKKAVGDGVYSGAETARRRVKAGKMTAFAATLQNDGLLPGTFKLRGSRTGGKVRSSYLVGGHNVTKSILSGTFEIPLAPGGSKRITIKVATKPDAIGKRSIGLSATNTVDGTLRDKVTAKLKIR